MTRILPIILILLLAPGRSIAQSRATVEKSTDVAMFVPAAVGAGAALLKGDRKGVLQLGEALAVSVATSYALKYSVSKRRPDGSDTHSFPSNHTGFAFAGATFLMERYGWQWGVPAYLVGGYVAWGRVYAKRHDVWDVLAGAAIGTASGLLFTTPFAGKHSVVLAPTVTPSGNCGVYISMTF